ITHLQNRLERALEEIPPGSPGLETVDAAIGDSERILSLFSALLRISEVESGTVRRYFRTFDLSAQSAMVVESYSAVAEDKGCQLLSDIEP
ncbi:HAMP domain-containing histidine kinase, partial [Escherichia coli]|nr:HAMP domain-containing histidine kinase [Escherichia coli]